MPVTLNVGYSRKIGEPNYGSRGASVNLQIEKDLTLVENAGQIREQIDELFGIARAAVEAELTRKEDGPAAHAPVNGHIPPPPGITPNQLQAIRSLSRRKGIELDVLLEKHGGARRLEQLTRQQASRLINDLDLAPEAA